MSKIDSILEDRGKSYGSYDINVEAVASIMGILHRVHKDKTGETLNLIDYSNLSYIVIKLVRLGATPDHLDSLKDIQGYAKLAEDYYTTLKVLK